MRLPKAISSGKPPRRAGGRRLVGAGLLCCALAARGADIEYLYINASEGTASGGHAALRLGDEVFHFQHVPPGLLRAQRDDFAWFRLQYGDKENRTIYRHRVEVSAETRDLLRERFNRVLLIEQEQFDRRDGLEQDRRLLETFLHRQGEAEGLALKGPGLFLADGWNYADAVPEGSPAPLARRVAAVFGDGFLLAKRRALLRSLADLRPEVGDPQSIDLTEDGFRPAGLAFAERYANHLRALAALQVLALGLAPREGVLSRPEAAEFRLDEVEKQALAAYRARLEGQLLGLFRSGREDWGLALLVGVARLAALDESLASGRLVFVNLAEPPADEAPQAVPEASRPPADAGNRARFLRAKAAMAGAVDEWDYADLEQAANRFEAGGEARLTALPAQVAKIAPRPPAGMTPAQLRDALARLEPYQQAYGQGLAGLYAYDLLGRNCASEIFRVVDAAMAEAAGSAGAARAESMRRLGGQVSARFPGFIPFVSFQAVGGHWRVAATEELPSYRLRRLEQARRQENPLRVDLRESNVFSSTLYRWHRGDAAFVFFTDDTVWARPLAGGANLAAGLAQGVFGLFTLPWDGGANLWQGAKGVLVSLPELFFFNIRKGSFPDLPRVAD